MTGIPAADEVIEEQGWNERTLLELLIQFVKDGNQVGAFVQYLEVIAAMEDEA